MRDLATQATFLGNLIKGEYTSVGQSVILIDGRSGSGKTHFARLLSHELFKATQVEAQLVHMDDLYAGWEGLRLGANILVSDILKPLSLGISTRYQKWNWTTGTRGIDSEPGQGWCTVDPWSPVIVEGCAAVSVASRSLATTAIWIESDLEARINRLAHRDNGAFTSHQANWSSQEDEFYSQESTLELCDHKVIN